MEKVIKLNLFRLLLFVISSSLLYAGITIEKAEIVRNELCLHFSAPIDKKDIHHFTLSNPYREVFDFKNVNLNKKYDSIIPSLKIAQYKPNILRVVIEEKNSFPCIAYQPMLSDKRYHISLPKNKNFSLKSKNNLLKVKKYTKKESLREKSSVKIIDKPTLIDNKHHKKTIVIDAGHGGYDNGATTGKKKEKDLVLSISKKVKKELTKRGYIVHLTRTSNRFLKLSQRTKIADEKSAAVFISIHANSVPKSKQHITHGVETFFLQATRDEKSQLIAARENKAVLKGAGRLSKKIIIDSVLNGPKIVQSNKLAIDVQGKIISNLRKKYADVRDGGVRHAPFYVLVGASRPSILVEVGYLSHPRESKRLFTSSYQQLIAKGIAEGVNNYLNNREKEIDTQ